MPTDDDDRPIELTHEDFADFEENDPTIVAATAPTRPQCLCGQPVENLGPICPEAEAMAANYPFVCTRGAGSSVDWNWCASTWVLVCRVRR